jgi:hypothetical protein
MPLSSLIFVSSLVSRAAPLGTWLSFRPHLDHVASKNQGTSIGDLMVQESNHNAGERLKASSGQPGKRGASLRPLNIKAYKEFYNKHRPEGWNFWFTLAISPAPPRAPEPQQVSLLK